MKKSKPLVSMMMLGLLMVAFAAIKLVSAQYDFNAYVGKPIENKEIDGVIGNEWNDAGIASNVAIDPQGTAEIWTKHDDTYVYIAVRFTADSNNPWMAFQFSSESACMARDADGALFGYDSYAADGYLDIYYSGGWPVTLDASQDGTGAIRVDTSNVVTVELKKPINSGDSAGKDLAWKEDSTYGMIITWDSDGDGSSGGQANHVLGSTTVRNMLINSAENPVPEFPGLVFTVFLLITAISAVLLKKAIQKPTASV